MSGRRGDLQTPSSLPASTAWLKPVANPLSNPSCSCASERSFKPLRYPACTAACRQRAKVCEPTCSAHVEVLLAKDAPLMVAATALGVVVGVRPNILVHEKNSGSKTGKRRQGMRQGEGGRRPHLPRPRPRPPAAPPPPAGAPPRTGRPFWRPQPRAQTACPPRASSRPCPPSQPPRA